MMRVEINMKKTINIITTSYAVIDKGSFSTKRVYRHYDKNNYVKPGTELTKLYNDYEYFLELFSVN